MLKRFLSYYRPHLKLFTLDMTCAFFMTGIDLIFPMITRGFINDIIPNGKYILFWKFSILLLFLYVTRSVLQYVLEYWGHVVGIRMEADMRRDLFTHLQTLSFSYYDKSRTGQLMSRVINDLNSIAETAHHGRRSVYFIDYVNWGFLVLIKINVLLTLLIFAVIPLIIWYATKKRIKMIDQFRGVRKKVADINAQLENSISGIRVAKAFTNEDYELNKFNVDNHSLRSSKEGAYKAMAEFYTGIGFLANVLKLIVLVGGGYFVFKDKINYGDLVAYLLYIHLFINPIRSLSHFLQQFQQAQAGFERFVDIMDTEPEIQDKVDAIELVDANGEIIFDQVSFSYDDKEKVLKNVNLNLEAGKSLAIVGPSGGGKTTLCNLIPRFYEVESGQILIDGHSIKDLTLSSLRKNIGVVQQDVFLFSGTIKENILYGKPNALDEEIVTAAKNANIHEFIMQLPDQYDTYVGERGIRLSGGQKQRVSIARVFLKNPPILILDEATSSLDNESEMIIQQALSRLADNRTTLVIAHRLSTIKDADRIVVLNEDGIQEEGTHQELLLENGLYFKLYNAQFQEYTA